MYKTITQILLKGLTIVLPVTVAVYVLCWLVYSSENGVKFVLKQIMPIEFYIPGMGLVIVFAIIFVVGLLMYPWITRTVISKLDGLLRQIPLFGSVYSPVKDLMDLFGGDMGQQLGRPVMIRIPNTEMDTLGFVTREDADGLPKGIVPDDADPKDFVVVFVQWSSQIGGYCFLVPKSSVRSIDMTVEEGMRWSLTGGLSAPKDKS